MTNEASVLKKIREESNLSMRQLGVEHYVVKSGIEIRNCANCLEF